jgi:5'-phosphate synthase pdxT subunit
MVMAAARTIAATANASGTATPARTERAVRAGVLALQGDFTKHLRALPDGAVEVRTARAIDELDLLVLPGGESTTMLKLLDGTGVEDAVRRLVARGGVVFGTCAGAILLAKSVTNPPQRSFGLIGIDVERNAFGRQVDSFESTLDPDDSGAPPLAAVFIRAPRIRRVGPEVEILARWRGEPVLVREGRVFAATFHPELTTDPRVHALVFAEAHAFVQDLLR